MAHTYRDDFPLLNSLDIAYLDNAATAQRPQCVLDAVTEFYKSKNANPLRGLYPSPQRRAMRARATPSATF